MYMENTADSNILIIKITSDDTYNLLNNNLFSSGKAYPKTMKVEYFMVMVIRQVSSKKLCSCNVYL